VERSSSSFPTEAKVPVCFGGCSRAVPSVEPIPIKRPSMKQLDSDRGEQPDGMLRPAA